MVPRDSGWFYVVLGGFVADLGYSGEILGWFWAVLEENRVRGEMQTIDYLFIDISPYGVAHQTPHPPAAPSPTPTPTLLLQHGTRVSMALHLMLSQGFCSGP